MKCCGKYCACIGWGLRQEENPTRFYTVDLYICETCAKTHVGERNLEDFPPRTALPDMSYCRFVLNRNRVTWPKRPRNKYDEYAEEHGISYLHAIHELDGA
jgi:hypothetical protein